jgi:hypothetical protein
MARGRHTGENEAHSLTRNISHENGGEGRQRWLPTVLPAWRSLRKQQRLGLDELEHAIDLRAKLGRLQLAVGEEGN